MGKTISEKIIARVANKSEVNPGEFVQVKPDLTGGYNMREPGTSIHSTMPDLELVLGLDKVKNPAKHILFLDHYHPSRTQEEAERNIRTRAWSQKYKVRLLEGVGISHQAVIELGL